jgi:hypothetical protein
MVLFWIESHQDRKVKALNSWDLLNTICDTTTKALWNYAAMMGSLSTNQWFGDEGWSIRVPNDANYLVVAKINFLMSIHLLIGLPNAAATNTLCISPTLH